MCASKVIEGNERGWIVPIGGAENKEKSPQILSVSSDSSGGTEADIVVIPTASRMHETGPRYEKVFSEMGAARVDRRWTSTRGGTARSRGGCERLAQASGIFFTGGNQLRLTTLLGGTPVAKAITPMRNAHGVTVGGTSAGRGSS